MQRTREQPRGCGLPYCPQQTSLANISSPSRTFRPISKSPASGRSTGPTRGRAAPSSTRSLGTPERSTRGPAGPESGRKGRIIDARKEGDPLLPHSRRPGWPSPLNPSRGALHPDDRWLSAFRAALTGPPPRTWPGYTPFPVLPKPPFAEFLPCVFGHLARVLQSGPPSTGGRQTPRRPSAPIQTRTSHGRGQQTTR